MHTKLLNKNGPPKIILSFSDYKLMSSFHFVRFFSLSIPSSVSLSHFLSLHIMIASNAHNNNSQDLFSVYIVALWFWNASICHENQPENCVLMLLLFNMRSNGILYHCSVQHQHQHQHKSIRKRSQREWEQGKRQSKRIESKILCCRSRIKGMKRK